MSDGPDLAEILGHDPALTDPTSAQETASHLVEASYGPSPGYVSDNGRVLWTTRDPIGAVQEWIRAAGRDLGTLAVWIRFHDPACSRGVLFVLSGPRPGGEAELVVVGHTGALTRPVLRAACRWAFIIVGLSRIVVRIPTSRPDLADLARRAGFRFEGAARCGLGAAQDAQTWATTLRDCRWLPGPQLAIPPDTTPPVSMELQ